jgi:hypothetical protein
MRTRDSPVNFIDRGVQMREQKPCYINICCNLAGLPHPSFASVPVPFSITPQHTNEARRSGPLGTQARCSACACQKRSVQL